MEGNDVPLIRFISSKKAAMQISNFTAFSCLQDLLNADKPPEDKGPSIKIIIYG